jgi:hypothetical protein
MFTENEKLLTIFVEGGRQVLPIHDTSIAYFRSVKSHKEAGVPEKVWKLMTPKAREQRHIQMLADSVAAKSNSLFKVS